MKRIKEISRSAKTNIPIVLISTGLVFILLLLTMIISNGIIIFCVNSGFITGRPGGTPLLPFLLQSGILSIFIGVILTLVLSHFPLRPVSRLINAIHAVAAGNFHVKIRIKHPKEFRELAESFNQMTDELAGIEMLRSDFINNFSHEFRMCGNIFSVFSVTAEITFAVCSRDQDDRASLSVNFTDFVPICLKSRHIHTGEHDPGGTSCSVQSPLRLIGEEAMKHGIPLYVAVYLSIHYSVYDRKCFHFPSHSPDVLSRITELTASFRSTTADRST